MLRKSIGRKSNNLAHNLCMAYGLRQSLILRLKSLGTFCDAFEGNMYFSTCVWTCFSARMCNCMYAVNKFD